jgi:hypothetical protein
MGKIAWLIKICGWSRTPTQDVRGLTRQRRSDMQLGLCEAHHYISEAWNCKAITFECERVILSLLLLGSHVESVFFLLFFFY